RRLDLGEGAGRDIDAGEVRTALLLEEADDAAVRLEAVHRHGELPLRLAELGGHRMQGHDVSASLAVEVPPAAPVRGEVQFARGRPFRLEDRFLGAAGDAAR